MQPTVRPSHVLYDGMFVDRVPYVPPISTLSDYGVCNGQLEVLNNTSWLRLVNNSNYQHVGLAELWCVQYKSQTRYRYFGLSELQASIAVRNFSEYTSSLLRQQPSLSVAAKDNKFRIAPNLTVQSLIIRGKGSEWWFHNNKSDTMIPSPLSSSVMWQDTLLECPFFESASFGGKKLLSVAREKSWGYGKATMIQKVRVSNQTSSSRSRGAKKSPAINSTNIIGAFILQKGSVLGGMGHAQIVAARTSWQEDDVDCRARAQDLVLDECSGVPASVVLAAKVQNAAVNNTIRSIIRHTTTGWSVADVTEMTRCQLRIIEEQKKVKGASFELGFMWQPVSAAEDVHFFRNHYPFRAAGDVEGDADRVFNASIGVTEWLSSESNDPPVLALYYV